MRSGGSRGIGCIKKDPAAAVSEPVAPIVYYVDNGAPEPIRSALVEGAAWWDEAFEAAGFRGAFVVKVLPEDADPMDLRYNMINWVHRSSRGWSYGGSVVDPRTGEILKGNVTLGSLRIRQDYMLGSGMVPQFGGLPAQAGRLRYGELDPLPDMHVDRFACDFGALPELDYLADLDPSSDAVAMSLARIRQLSAHETGHTLGFAHNFAASTYGRASVMDYPAPSVGIKDGRLDLSDAYGKEIGAFDKFSVTYAYAQFAPGADEERELQRIIAGGVAAGPAVHHGRGRAPARRRPPAGQPVGQRHRPRGHAAARDGGADARDEHVRHHEDPGGAVAQLPRSSSSCPCTSITGYQVQATAKSVGGQYYTYAVRKGNAPSPAVTTIVAPDVQRAALNALLETLSPDVLVVPERILALLQPQTEVFGGYNTEMFPRRTGLTLNPVSAASIAADVTIAALLNHERAARSSSSTPATQESEPAGGDRRHRRSAAHDDASRDAGLAGAACGTVGVRDAPDGTGRQRGRGGRCSCHRTGVRVAPALVAEPARAECRHAGVGGAQGGSAARRGALCGAPVLAVHPAEAARDARGRSNRGKVGLSAGAARDGATSPANLRRAAIGRLLRVQLRGRRPRLHDDAGVGHACRACAGARHECRQRHGHPALRGQLHQVLHGLAVLE